MLCRDFREKENTCCRSDAESNGAIDRDAGKCFMPETRITARLKAYTKNKKRIMKLARKA